MAFRATGNTVINDVQNGKFNAVTYRNFFSQKTQAQGFNFAYVVGGTENGQTRSTIDKFPFAVETTNSTQVANLPYNKSAAAGQSSSVHGYHSGGVGNQPAFTPTIVSQSILKFPFATESNISTVGGLSVYRYRLDGHSSVTHGYSSGGFLNFIPAPTSSIIDKFPFATDTNATNVGNLTVAKMNGGTQSSITHGYYSGGFLNPTTYSLVIERFPFATDTNATNVGNLTGTARYGVMGQSSPEHGYSSGGARFDPFGAIAVNVIDRFPFAVSTTNATNVGTLTVARYIGSGHSSITHGYSSGGNITSEQAFIDRFPFAVTLANAVTVGNLSAIRALTSSHQY